MHPIINLISGPRNISTALMYSFAQRDDTTVLDEPFYAYYLANASLSINHPSHQEIISFMSTDEKKIIQDIEQLSMQNKVFVKGMAHHFLQHKPKHILNWKNIILIRHPEKLLASFSKVIPNPTLDDIGIKKAAKIYRYLTSNDKVPIVIDSDELMKHPSNYLQKLCAALEIPFFEEMLDWKKGGIPEDGIWAKHWYQIVHQTTGFKTQQKKRVEVPKHLSKVLQEAIPYYAILKERILINS